MIKSMTGYGRGEAVTAGKKFTFELKAVNHRYNEVVLRLPRSLTLLEDRIRRLIQARTARGRVDGFLGLEECGEKNATVKVDKALAAAYYNAMKELQENLGIGGDIQLKQLVALPGVLTVAEPADDVEEWWPAIQIAVEAAVDNLVRMRTVEGEQLSRDLLKRVEQLTYLNQSIRERSPQVVEDYRERLGARLNDYMRDGIITPERLAAEATIFAERSSITEENVRLESHLQQMKSCLTGGESVGRKLDFLIQEMNREINTIASKASDLEISRAVVEAKSELEKIREQVQNIE
ncbi:MAG: YicC family protein [Desulfotomaculaceae bacterium]|nr:YicC family protein [Desulfotomaculaceae bacterium]